MTRSSTPIRSIWRTSPLGPRISAKGSRGYPCGGYSAVGDPEALPGWTGQLTIPQTYDLGLVHITQWVAGETRPTSYGQVAPVGYLDRLAADAPQGKGNIEFTVVGYGLQSVKPVESAIKQRMVGTVSFATYPLRREPSTS